MAKNSQSVERKPQQVTATRPTPPAKDVSMPKDVIAFAIVKADIGQNLWQLVTYTIRGNGVVKAERSVEDLREILIANIPDLIGGLL